MVAPPGAGKISTLSNAIWALTGQKYKAMVVGPPSWAVNQAVNSVVAKYPTDKKWKGTFELLRLVVKSAELRAMIKVKNQQDQDPDKVPEIGGSLDIEEDAALNEAIATAAKEYDTDNKILRKLRGQKQTVEQILKALDARDDRRNAQVPFSMTSNYYLLILSNADESRAKTLHDETKAAWKAPKASASALQGLLSRPDKITKDHDLYKASASDVPSENELGARLKDGRIPPEA